MHFIPAIHCLKAQILSSYYLLSFTPAFWLSLPVLYFASQKNNTVQVLSAVEQRNIFTPVSEHKTTKSLGVFCAPDCLSAWELVLPSPSAIALFKVNDEAQSRLQTSRDYEQMSYEELYWRGNNKLLKLKKGWPELFPWSHWQTSFCFLLKKCRFFYPVANQSLSYIYLPPSLTLKVAKIKLWCFCRQAIKNSRSHEHCSITSTHHWHICKTEGSSCQESYPVIICKHKCSLFVLLEKKSVRKKLGEEHN